MTEAIGSIVLFLGAGSSAAFGYPVTSEILKIIRDRLRTGTLFSDQPGYTCDVAEMELKQWDLTGGKQHIATFPEELDARDASDAMRMLDERLGVLLPGLNHAGVQLPMITDVLSLVDHLLTNGDACSPRFMPRYLEELRDLLERAIMEVLKEPVDRERASKGQHRLDKLSDWILRTKKETGRPVTIISTNYDILLENEIYRRLGDRRTLASLIDFGFSWRDPGSGEIHPPPVEPTARIYKLHGSLNWLRCQLCGHIYINELGTIFHLAFQRRLGWGNTCHCLQGPLRTVIVAPSMIRTIRDPNLLSIWQRALGSLREAHKWVIAGYSLPGEDLAIRSILMRAERAHVGPCDIDVVQRDGLLKGRFELMFPNCRYLDYGIEGFIDSLPTYQSSGNERGSDVNGLCSRKISGGGEGR